MTPEAPAAIETAIETFLLALDTPDGGETLHDAHAAGAFLIHDDRGLPKREVPRAAYAAAHRQRLVARAWPSYGVVAIERVEAAGPGRAIARLMLSERTDGVQFPLAAGLALEDGTWRVEWLLAGEAPAALSWDRGRSSMLGLFPFLRKAAMPARTWLDLAYERQHRLSRPPLLFLEGARFSCQGSTSCCRYDWGLPAPAEGQAFLDAVPWEEVAPHLAGVKLPVGPDGQLSIKERHESCRFLDAAGSCLIHKAYGQPFFTPCTVFPFLFAETPEGVAVGTSYFCESARSQCGAPLADRTDDLHGRLAQAGARTTDAYRLAPGLAVEWPVFKQVEGALLALLGAEDLSLWRRLWLGSRFLEASLAGASLDLAAWAEELVAPLAPSEAGLVSALLTLLVNMVTDKLAGPVPEKMAEAIAQEAVVARWFENVVHVKVLSYPHDLLTAQNMLAMLYLLVLRLQGPGPMPERTWAALGAFVMHGGLDGLIETLVADDPTFRVLLGGPDSGRLFLRYALLEVSTHA